jgi:hypothetical protein
MSRSLEPTGVFRVRESSRGRSACGMRTYRTRKPTLRLRTHDYRGDGNYLITFGVHRRQRLLGVVAQNRLWPSLLGSLVLEQLDRIQHWCPWAAVDCHAVMPDHVHLIMVMRGAHYGCETRGPCGPVAGSVSMVVGQLKSRVTAAAIREGLWPRGARLWKRSFHDGWLPDLRALKAARRYLELNPPRWQARYGPGVLVRNVGVTGSSGPNTQP